MFDPVFFDRDSGWVGQTYAAAQQFCDSKSRILCPKPAICPHQPGAEEVPVNGIMEGVVWVPLDTENLWVQIGQEWTCRNYGDLFDHPSPMWGLTGEDNESITRHIVCCRDGSEVLPMDIAQPPITVEAQPETADVVPPITKEETEPAPVVSVQPSKEVEPAVVPVESVPSSADVSEKWDSLATQVYEPQWYTTAQGYSPSTHFGAQIFCKEQGQVLCPLVAYCPSGTKVEGGRSPLWMGMEVLPGENWAPIGDSLDLVQVGTFEGLESSTCKTLSAMDNGQFPDDPPELGDTVLCCKGGEENADLPCGDGFRNSGVCSRTEKCCSKNGFCADCGMVSLLDPPDAVETDDASNADVTASTPDDAPPESVVTASTPDDAPPDIDLSDPMVAAGYHYGPFWITRANGWIGGNYNDAVTLCESFEAHLCPYEAYCPLGKSRPVMPGYPDDFDADEENYAPIGGFENSWINLGKKDGSGVTTCQGYSQLYSVQPAWGLTSDEPDMKKYIMCCTRDGA